MAPTDVLNISSISSLRLFADRSTMSLVGSQINHTIFTKLLQWKTSLPIDITSLVSIVVLLSGILCNAFLGLYVGERLDKPCGIRTLICNQIFANLIAVFSYTFAPLHVLDKEPIWKMNRLCKVVPSVGFLGVSVSLTNIAAICVSYYFWKKPGKFAISSHNASLLVVLGTWLLAIAITVPMMVSLTTLEVKMNHSAVFMCVSVWTDAHYQVIYMNCVFVFKYAVPLLIIFSACLNTELVHFKSKKFQQCREISSVLINILAAIGLVLFIIFFPRSSMGTERLPCHNSYMAIDTVHILDYIALIICAMIPMLLTALIDEYHQTELISDNQRIRKPAPDLYATKVNKHRTLEFTSNVNSVTYDVLTADMPEKWRRNPSGVLIV